jgi:zinc/manganese transport system permease protein
VYLLIGIAHARLHPKTLAVSEGREVRHTRWLDLFFYGSFAVVVTSSVSLVGVLLVFSLLVIPAVSATLLATSDRIRLLLGWSFAVVGGYGGLHTAFHADMPAGPSIVLVLGAIVVGSALLAAWRGRARVR